MRENRTYGLMRERAYPARDAPPYSTSRSGGVTESLKNRLHAAFSELSIGQMLPSAQSHWHGKQSMLAPCTGNHVFCSNW
jgi:hypothetical protein